MNLSLYKHCTDPICVSSPKVAEAVIVTVAIAGVFAKTMEQRALKNVNNCLNTDIYSYLETSGGQSSNPYLNVVLLFNTRLN